MRDHVRQMAVSCASVVALSCLWASPALSAFPGIKETVTVQNQYGLAAGTGTSFVPQAGGAKETFYIADALPGESSEVGVNYTGIADVGSFFFLHDNYTVGSGSTYSQTVITFTLTNQTDNRVALRFDSQITPGHIAHLRGDSNQRGSFDFRVTQTFSDGVATLYSANGGVNSDGAYLNSGNLQYNGLTESFDPDGRWEVIDWSATTLSVPLLILDGGETTEVSYIATYETSSDAVCSDVLNCAGLQVVFGDPRNDGGVTNVSDFRNLAANLVDDGVYPVIGRNYDAYRVPFAFVALDAPLPENPAGEGPIKYGPLFDPRAAVPEPATWAMMIGGFGLLGGAVRRRRETAAAA